MPSHLNGAGTGFVGLNDYLNANQGTMSNDVNSLTGGVAAQGDKAKGLDDMVGQDAYTATAGGSPYDSSKDSNYQKAVDANTAVGTAANALGQDPAGALAAKNPAIGNPYGYGAGAQQFDNALFGADTGAKAAFAGTKAQYGGLSSYLDDAVQEGKASGAGAWGDSQTPSTHGTPAPKTTTTSPTASTPQNQEPVDQASQHANRARTNANGDWNGPADDTGGSGKGSGGEGDPMTNGFATGVNKAFHDTFGFGSP